MKGLLLDIAASVLGAIACYGLITLVEMLFSNDSLDLVVFGAFLTAWTTYFAVRNPKTAKR